MRWSQAVLRGAEHKDEGLLPLDVPAGCGGKVGLSNLPYLFVGLFDELNGDPQGLSGALGSPQVKVSCV